MHLVAEHYHVSPANQLGVENSSILGYNINTATLRNYLKKSGAGTPGSTNEKEPSSTGCIIEEITEEELQNIRCNFPEEIRRITAG